MIKASATLSELAESLNGLPVHGCLPGSSAERAGVRFGDILLAVDGHPTPTWQAVIAARQKSGASMRVRLFRDGREFELDIPLDRETRHDPESIVKAIQGERDEAPEVLH